MRTQAAQALRRLRSALPGLAAAALLASGCRRGRLIHIGHDILHADLLRRLPAPVAPSFDGERLPL